ncbi:MAG: hypothetical protein MMC33_010746 [Icmadophila ericetorum]|nr:hypothetical protein [Icmadophila ericetorum]
MGAGVQAYDAYYAADAQGLRVVGGECPTVGLAGGYTQGGGHSVLASVYGLGADQALEWEVVIANGSFVTASPTQNSELYWALSGGGGGTYGVVVSLTAKAHADGPVTGASLSFNSSGISQDSCEYDEQSRLNPIDRNLDWELIATWHTTLLSITENGGAATTLFGTDVFEAVPVTFPNQTTKQAQTLMEPMIATLENGKIPYSLTYKTFSNYLDFVENYFGPLPYGTDPASQLTGSRLIARSSIENNLDVVTAAFRNVSIPGPMITIAQQVSHSIAGNTRSANAVLPAWRDAAVLVVLLEAWNFTAPWAQDVAQAAVFTDSLVPQLDAVSPGSGTYLNEANFEQPNWKEDFYGSNYERLRAVKRLYDPEDLFYATTAVGSDAWYVAADGRLCRA